MSYKWTWRPNKRTLKIPLDNAPESSSGISEEAVERSSAALMEDEGALETGRELFIKITPENSPLNSLKNTPECGPQNLDLLAQDVVSQRGRVVVVRRRAAPPSSSIFPLRRIMPAYIPQSGVFSAFIGQSGAPRPGPTNPAAVVTNKLDNAGPRHGMRPSTSRLPKYDEQSIYDSYSDS
ncbi:hypothetical protein M501DRAFT_1018184 [Patellaria atrata CBS 101060]|uniref:Uncharacterized protein n=1 Tax=Patellaria atrata CBS 101060 TaxID=1346257 RepID=A0A9P4S7B8_9PEZI|nr:hypothetical protein M501DRAFT_1018184 [Patellaria atrata CBS 101060]